jgi:hypothetical protein
MMPWKKEVQAEKTVESAASREFERMFNPAQPRSAPDAEAAIAASNDKAAGLIGTQSIRKEPAMFNQLAQQLQVCLTLRVLNVPSLVLEAGLKCGTQAGHTH